MNRDQPQGTRTEYVAAGVFGVTEPARRRGRCGWWRRDEGGATVEFVIAVPLLLLMVMFIAQGAVWMHATHVAQAVATRALDAARAYGGSAAQGRAGAEQALNALGSGVLRDVQVSVVRTATTATVEILATATTVVPGVHWPIHTVMSAPVERFVPATDSG